ncbi:glycoside hydrolase family 43 protein [Flavivirga eckloniae]|uniref:Glycoside hydrolase 43 family protein n=1 Tax=Flavivirga eckloniae TaxID=1803846 RepID=A0A2K9PUY3_9FLAO|nr:glycoside hydrolase family 43 protein [Flavivirga eckloniae]AUP80885.1 glycoside hydrolase 43 family protein [Flavivirga eckloniae]
MYLRTIKLLLAFVISFSIYGQNAPDNFKNPILSGFYPDPSICRVGDTYYMVNSSFEWFPGLPIHESKDLVNWKLIGHGLSRPTQIDYKDGLRNSNGIFAPTIRYREGKFYIICTMVGGKGNFIITAEHPAESWSDPIWIKDAPGIDPSLFWDDDGRCYYTGAGVIDGTSGDWPGKNGIWMQEINPDKGELIGEKKQLTFGHASNARWAEGPHLFKINGEYLLLIGEGGTGEYHSVTVFNSKNLWGPYIPNHANPVMTHRHLSDTYAIGQTGHADLVQTQNGDWWSVMLAKRKVDGYITLARETFLAKVKMTEQESGITPIFNPGKGLLQFEQKRPDLPWTPVAKKPTQEDFNNEELPLDWNFLRTPKTNWYTIKKGYLGLKLRPQTLEELKNPSFIGRRTLYHNYEAATKVHFKTKKANESAGLAIYRRNGNSFQLLKQKDQLVLIKVYQKDNVGDITPKEMARVPYKGDSVIFHVKVEGVKAQFSYGTSLSDLKQIGDIQDYAILSDEIAQRFNGVYIGVYATSSGEESKRTSNFDWFSMKEIN